ncbi:hypothetical protein [Streptomyces sp. NPDC001604]|uniref:hypothetical protein n=1 Tax=Streptomyces sp. NPDC001604 TaxID=3364593 RepID=UPI003674563D
MSKQQKAAVGMVVALAASAYLSKYAKQQGATLGLSAAVVSVIGLAVGHAI